MFDFDIISQLYATMAAKVQVAQQELKRPMTLAEKVLYSHLYSQSDIKEFVRGEDYVNFSPDRVAMQDATAQMALLQFMNAGRDKVALPTSVHCDHLIQANKGAQSDLSLAKESNREVYDFLKSVASKYGIGYWRAGAGIIHQQVLENYAFPGGMIIGTDSHTPNGGGLGMIAIGVGGADAVDVMTAMPWELKMPKIIGVKLTGSLSGWCSPKDVILKLAGILSVKGGTNSIIEYFGDGATSLSATGKATICNMGAEVGATTSIFPYDKSMAEYLCATGREKVASAANDILSSLRADSKVEENPSLYFDRVIEINLSELEPYINGPFTPDAAHTISEFAEVVKSKRYPQKMEVGLIGSCTNSSYQDLARAASVASDAAEKGVVVAAELIINPGSQQVHDTAERDGILDSLKKVGGVVMTNACGPCIGQWKRNSDDNTRANSIVTSFNRNFAKRADGNANTHAFVTSPEIVMALTIAGDLCFNPLTDSLSNKNGEMVRLSEPKGDALPSLGFEVSDNGYVAPVNNGDAIDVIISPESQRLQRLERFAPFNSDDFKQMRLLIKVEGKCTTDHISMAGEWLKYRGHLDNISNNLLMGAINIFNGESNCVLNAISGDYCKVSTLAREYKKLGVSSIVFAEENYGEGSSREHAAMEPRFLNVKAIIVKSFARIHETNLKKQGVLALTFVDKSDYDKVREDDVVAINGVENIAQGENLSVTLMHKDGTTESFEVQHSYNQLQINWLKAGSALNC